MYKSSTLTHRELAVFVAVVVVVFVLFFAPNFAVIEKIRKDVEELTIEDEADHLPHKYCATMDQIQGCADRCQTSFSDLRDPVTLSCYRMCTNFCTCEKGIAFFFYKYIDKYCEGQNSTCYKDCTWTNMALATKIPEAELRYGYE